MFVVVYVAWTDALHKAVLRINNHKNVCDVVPLKIDLSAVIN